VDSVSYPVMFRVVRGSVVVEKGRGKDLDV
jgi:hypothetical protein